MFERQMLSANRKDNYATLLITLPSMISKHEPWYTNLANVSALISFFVDDLNWVGFYMKKDEMLYLGPFQGLPACTQITFGKGVCGESAKKKTTMIMNDVSSYANHIVCDAKSRSEIVIPIVKNNEVIGVLDIDSPTRNRFGNDEQKLFETVVGLLVDIPY